MPWMERTVMTERQRFCQLALADRVNFSALCRLFGISRKTGYKWKTRYLADLTQPLSNRSRKPKHSPYTTLADIQELILEVRDEHPNWGGVKIKAFLEELGYTAMPCSKTINRILKRCGRITADESQKHTGWHRFEHAHPNDLWQMDFKGPVMTQDGTQVHPFTLLDDHSRYSLAIIGCVKQTTEHIQRLLTQMFKHYGMPKRMTMDNGPPWGYSGAQEHTRLCAWLMRLGIYVTHSRPGHPQTQGKIERFHRTLNQELLSRYYFDDLEHLQDGLNYFQDMYNTIRPHAAIDHKTPATRYRLSERTFPSKLPEIVYPDTDEVRQVSADGEIRLYGKRYRIGEAFAKQPVGIRIDQSKDSFADIYFVRQKILTIDLQRPVG